MAITALHTSIYLFNTYNQRRIGSHTSFSYSLTIPDKSLYLHIKGSLGIYCPCSLIRHERSYTTCKADSCHRFLTVQTKSTYSIIDYYLHLSVFKMKKILFYYYYLHLDQQCDLEFSMLKRLGYFLLKQTFRKQQLHSIVEYIICVYIYSRI